MALLVAVLMPVFLLVSAVVVDIGMLRVARADAQALADVVALDLARRLDGRSIDGNYLAEMDAAAADSLARNTSVIGYDEHLPALTIELGGVDEAGSFVALSSGVPTAVRVSAELDVDLAFAGVTGDASGQARRRAVAMASSAACFQLGSWAAVVEPAAASFYNEILGQLLGTSVLNMAGWNGLATADLALGDIVSASSIEAGSVDGLLAMSSLTADSWFLAMAEVLRRDGAVAEANVLDAAAASVVGGVVINVGDLLALGNAGDGALDTEFNALDLLVGTAFLANGEHFLDVPVLQAGVPSVGVTNTRLTVIENPRRACNQETARTAQVRLTADAKMLLKVPLLKDANVDLRLVDASGSPDGELSMGLQAELAGARGHLTDVDCDPATFTADVWTELVALRLSGLTNMEGSVKANVAGFGVLDVPVRFGLEVFSETSMPGGYTSVGPVTYPPAEYGEPIAAGGGAPQLPYVGVRRVAGSLQTGPVTVLGVPVSTDLLDAAVEPVLDSLNDAIRAEFSAANPLIDKVNRIVAALAAGLGVTTAGADFFALPVPQCAHPALRG